MNENQAKAPVFALTLAQANDGNIVDYTSRVDVKIYNKASLELLHKFHCNPKSVSMFCKKLKDRAYKLGQETARGDIINILDSKGIKHNLITEYGRLTEADIRNHTLTYVAIHSQRAQNNVQFYAYLSNSLTKEGHIKIIQEMEKY